MFSLLTLHACYKFKSLRGERISHAAKVKNELCETLTSRNLLKINLTSFHLDCVNKGEMKRRQREDYAEAN